MTTPKVHAHVARWIAIVALTTASCALVLDYGDYVDGFSGSGGAAGQGTPSSSGQGAAAGGGGQGGGSCSECHGASTPCRTVVCDAGCSFEDAPAGTHFDVTSGDCRAFECDGNGAAVAVDDDDDTPDMSGPCFVGTCSQG